MLRVLGLLAALIALNTAGLAQQPGAHVAAIDGDLFAQAPGQAGWRAAHPGEAVVAGQSLRTGAGTQAEVALAGGAVDLAPGTKVDVVAIGPGSLELALPQGRVRLALKQLEAGSTIAVDLPRGGLWIREAGQYDIDAGTMRQPSRITVLSGLAHFAGHDANTDIKTGEAALLAGVNPVFARFEHANADAFDAWVPAASLSGTGEPPAAARPPTIEPPREVRPPIIEREARGERRPERRRYAVHVYRHRAWRHAYAAYRPFNPLQPIFNLFR